MRVLEDYEDRLFCRKPFELRQQRSQRCLFTLLRGRFRRKIVGTGWQREQARHQREVCRLCG